MLINPLESRTGCIYGYARVSTKDQRLRAQRDALKAIGVDRIFEDKASGAKASRKGLDQMISILKPGDTVITFRLDRMGRSVLNLAELLRHFERHGIGFISLTEGIDTSTPSGKLVFNILAAIAEMQREVIAENTRSGLEAARKAGKRLGRPRAMTDQQIIEAKRMIKGNRYSRAQIASRFGVSRMTLHRAVA
ncbi:Site-specific recombinase, DNA invertase (Pin)-like protein [Hoeflea phototrophica DFL-43]|jgi:DNA invertase Pin-like site-specific DNA recombinase|uniref:Site-specific recombinase, DNA invertase (Pin)-like protein n=1 Tax=Hoeflea phototrophica (strain DSM 17068 / NCIMB 14078 / DFL-43) TaxID=411684 RepID=A9CY60_HOEPD|nr:recombinase family protein [Hoeflea phototrophica]EDQ34541.1 Site-specific recombinase, DNA invertase (Pin)-like protein [Hoeflea phototrophica DFL-43]